jgi:hypothetical protein
LAHHQYFWNNGKIIEISSAFFENNIISVKAAKVVVVGQSCSPFTRNLLETCHEGETNYPIDLSKCTPISGKLGM